MSDTVITGVAIMDLGGQMWALPRPARHHHLFGLASLMNGGIEEPCKQGFVDASGRFVSREVALEMVRLAGQPNTAPDHAKQLFSEDLW